LHGGAGRWQYSLELLETLAPDWHVFAPDLRGHGSSGRVADAYRLPDYVADIAALLEGVVREPAIVYGHSLGGEVGVMLAARDARFVRALIVGDSPLSPDNHITNDPTHRAQNVLWHQLSGRPIAEIVQALHSMSVVERPGAEPRPAREVFGEYNPWFEHQATSLHQLDPGVLAAVNAGPASMRVGYDPHELLPLIECPVLLLQADPAAGSALSDSEVELALTLLRRGTHVRLDGIGHPLHGPPGGTARVIAAWTPFLGAVSHQC
jgi:pimeloyl-ACP methyl ester carboxylesterase